MNSVVLNYIAECDEVISSRNSKKAERFLGKVRFYGESPF